MKKFIIIKLVFYFMISCEKKTNIREYTLPKQQKDIIPEVFQDSEIAKHNLIWDKPKSWIKGNKSSMRIASFSVPYDLGMADVSVIILEGDAGGMKLNINRWRRQLSLVPITMEKINNSLINVNGYIGDYKMIKIINNKIDKSFICAIIPLLNQTLFIKLSINPKYITDVESDFINFCSSIKYNN